MVKLGRFIDLNEFKTHRRFQSPPQREVTGAKRKQDASFPQDSMSKRQSRGTSIGQPRGVPDPSPQASDTPAETSPSFPPTGRDAIIDGRNRAPTVDLLVSPSRSDISVPSSASSQSSGNTTPVTENSNSNSHDLSLEHEPGRIAGADDDGEEAGLHPSKRRRILSSHSRRQSVRLIGVLFQGTLMADFISSNRRL
ncbi:hypothetical protein BDW59DRAFT_54126 [Aspergillus cavernicola]|uniref:Uncharacterized protein n=1 Tax=Aspergillus cavernicola TaxID=176166 RepID=A0ABR4H8E2_9EURO